MLDTTKTPKAIVEALDQYVIGQDEAKRIVAVAVYAHFRKVAPVRAGRRAGGQEQRAADRPLGNRQDAAVRDALEDPRRSVRHRRSDLARADPVRQRRDRGDPAAAGRQGRWRRREGRTRHRLHRRDRQAEKHGESGAPVRRERPARAAQDHGGRASQARRAAATSTRPGSCSSAAARSSASTRSSSRRRTAMRSSQRRRATARRSSTG